MMEGYYIYNVADSKSDNSKWTAQLVNDNQLNFGSGIIKSPTYTNFPKGGFTQNIVNINGKPVMYVIGGYTFSKQLNSTIITSCVFKYDFSSSSWSDLSEGSKSVLPPIAAHRTVQVNNALYIINGASPNVTYTYYPQVYSAIKPIKDNAINKMYKFDLLTEKWTPISIKTNLDSSKYGDVIMSGASYDSYNGNIISYGEVEIQESALGEPHCGTLDLTSFEWRWNQVKTDSGLDNSLNLYNHKTLIIRDQLLLFGGASNQNNHNKLFAINLKDFKFVSNLDYTGKSSASDSRPLYINVIIGLGAALGCILLIAIIIFYIRYRKKKLRDINNNRQIHAVWATSGNGTSSQALGGITIDDSHEPDIFSLDNTYTLEDPKYKSNELQEDLEHLTLVATKSDCKGKSNNSTNC
ncbi:hypothetical protein CONCODRAFT_12485 [Conidiobolus coronatus NRRL 28638]|uniref:Galactose oxidase n=1 Tax=Conidiobolus coronatus (strain ATCC 28846 / CBS 209.66 / NRRL 28638) TaxID=796925 RepID=A0A137NSV8_CONC2|nr:hypothetical protein CONCODRAFT_12485 [Conidiobolus coronatus NRRL 28638]|eukprot:KXN65821.1 hypothetical protein CONCODRAFT_12485 [Conidiobolus coronatus NRRL 28638]